MFRRKRQGETEGGTRAFFAFDLHSTMVPFDDFIGDIEPYAKPWKGFYLRLAHLIEPLKDALVVGCCNPDAKIPHAHNDVLAVFRDTHKHRVCCGRVLDGV